MSLPTHFSLVKYSTPDGFLVDILKKEAKN